MRGSAPLKWLLVTMVSLLLLVTGARATEIPDFTKLVEQHSAAVVSINATGERRSGKLELFPNVPIPEDSPFYDYFKRFFEQKPENAPRQRPLSSIGSGFIISKDGYVLTNAHVVQDTDNVTVGMNDRKEWPARVVGKDSRSDIALLKIEAGNLPTVKIGDSNKLKVGQWVLAIGSPFGFDRSATAGIISALGRSLPSDNYVPFIQTDAAVNPGNSGGPLFNLEGEVIGVNSQIYSRSGGYQGISFAIPIDVAMDVAEQLKLNGKVSRGWLGVLIQEVTPELAQSFGLDQSRGALVGQVMKDSPAQQAGIKTGDIIIAFDGQTIVHSSDLPPIVGRIRPGTEVSMTLIREGKERTVSVKIQELPDDLQSQSAIEQPVKNRLGITVKELPAEQKATSQGVLVGDVDEGPAAGAGIQPGDIIVNLNGDDISDVSQFDALVKKLPTGKPLRVLIQRGSGRMFLALTLPEDK